MSYGLGSRVRKSILSFRFGNLIFDDLRIHSWHLQNSCYLCRYNTFPMSFTVRKGAVISKRYRAIVISYDLNRGRSELSLACLFSICISCISK